MFFLLFGICGVEERSDDEGLGPTTMRTELALLVPCGSHVLSDDLVLSFPLFFYARDVAVSSVNRKHRWVPIELEAQPAFLGLVR